MSANRVGGHLPTPKVMSRSLLTGSNATLYTVPALTTALVTNIVLANSSATSVSVTVSFDGVVVVPAVFVAANSSTFIDLHQPLDTTKLITGFASTASVIACHITGLEVS